MLFVGGCLRQRMVVEQIAVDVENRNQPHLATALGATNGDNTNQGCKVSCRR